MRSVLRVIRAFILNTVDAIVLLIAAMTLIVLSLAGIFDLLPYDQTSLIYALCGIFAVFLLTYLIDRIRVRDQVEDIRRMSSRNVLENLERLPRRFDRKFAHLIERQIQHMRNNLEGLILERRIRVENAQEFSLFYEDALDSYSKAHFYATAFPRKHYFWGSDNVSRILERHIKGGGRMTRTFILNADDECNDAEVAEILNAQAAMGIEVRTIAKEHLNADQLRPFMITEDRSIGWLVETSGDDRVTGFVVTSNDDELDRLWSTMKKITSDPNCHPFRAE